MPCGNKRFPVSPLLLSLLKNIYLISDVKIISSVYLTFGSQFQLKLSVIREAEETLKHSNQITSSIHII